MNIKILVALSFSLLIVACGKTSNSGAPVNVAAVRNCEIYSPTPVKCNTHMPKPEVKINVNNPKPKADPQTICAAPGQTIEVTINPPKSGVTVVAVPKNAKNGWILATNVSDQNKMYITVPVGLKVKEEFDYLFMMSNGKCVDPRIRIGPSLSN